MHLIWVFGKSEYFCKRGWTSRDYTKSSPSGAFFLQDVIRRFKPDECAAFFAHAGDGLDQEEPALARDEFRLERSGDRLLLPLPACGVETSEARS
jgi:hypothetical protein